MDEPVEVTLEDGVATLRLANAEARNTLTPDVVEGAHDGLDGLEDVDCLVVRSAGEPFCAGGDLEAVVAGARGELSEETFVHRLERIDGLIERLDGFPAPTIAAVDGAAFGAGGALALACDVALASEDGAIGFGFHRVGMPVGAGASVLLPRTVGESMAAELLYTGELLDAERASDLGLFNRVVSAAEFDDRLDAFVETVAAGPGAAMNETGRLLSATDGRSLSTAMAAERDAWRRRFGTPEHREGVDAFLGKRDPAFERA